jgi:hypothetical protein
VVGGSLEEEAYQKLGMSHIQDGCYGGHIENTKSNLTTELMARLSQNMIMGRSSMDA